MTGTEFREGHGNPADWDDDEYEAYFAWTAPEQSAPTTTTTTADYQPAA